MDPHAASTEAERWLEIAGKLLAARDFICSKTFAIRARESDPRNPLSDQILAVVDTLLAAEKRVNSGYDWYAILQLAHLVRDPDLIAAATVNSSAKPSRPGLRRPEPGQPCPSGLPCLHCCQRLRHQHFPVPSGCRNSQNSCSSHNKSGFLNSIINGGNNPGNCKRERASSAAPWPPTPRPPASFFCGGVTAAAASTG